MAQLTRIQSPLSLPLRPTPPTTVPSLAHGASHTRRCPCWVWTRHPLVSPSPMAGSPRPLRPQRPGPRRRPGLRRHPRHPQHPRHPRHPRRPQTTITTITVAEAAVLAPMAEVVAPTAGVAAPTAGVAARMVVVAVAALVADIEAIKQLLNCIHWFTCFANFPSASCCI